MSELAARFERLVPWIRSQFPQLELLRNGDRRIYLDNAAGTLIPRTVSEAMADAAIWSNPQPGRSWPAGPETLRRQRRVRELLAAFLNAPPASRIFLSESTTASIYKLREGLEPDWIAEDNVVVTDCDHFANISPWEWRARWQVRRAGMLPDSHLDLDQLAARLDERTRVVALTLAGNGLGTLVRLEQAIPMVRERAPNAWVIVDAVHGAPHVPIDLQTLDADALAFSTYKLFGPNCGVLCVSDRLFRSLQPFRVEPHTDPETLLEWGTLSNSTVGGITACLEYLQRLGEKVEPWFVGQMTGYPRDRRLFKVALAAVRAYEEDLSRQILAALLDAPGLQLFGMTDPERTPERVPTFAFHVEAHDDAQVERRLWEEGTLQVASGSHYSGAVLRGLGQPSVIRASFAHYNSREEAEAFTRTLRAIVAG